MGYFLVSHSYGQDEKSKVARLLAYDLVCRICLINNTPKCLGILILIIQQFKKIPM